jgi:hypothetical protein
MKAFKQINYSFENRIVFGYAGLMSLLCFLILLSPVFAQDSIDLNKNQPKVHYDVKKEYDKDGNLTAYDSISSWFWSDKEIGIHDYDSLLKQFHQQFDIFNDNWNWSGNEPFSDLPLMNPFRYLYDVDSAGSYLYDSIFNKLRLNDSWSGEIPSPFHNFLPSDSLDISSYHFDDLSNFFDHRYNIDQYQNDDESLRQYLDQHEEFMELFKEYQKEHQKLIEKYFNKPFPKMEAPPPYDPQKDNAPVDPSGKSKSGRI